MADQSKYLITGASGQLGKLVLDLLLDEHHVAPSALIATTRKPEKLAEYAARGVTVRSANFDDPGSLQAAFAGATRLLLISTDAVAVPGQRLGQQRNAVAAARAAGVKHVLYTSMTQPDPASPIPFARDHVGTEQALLDSGLGYTFLRNHWYLDSLLTKLPQVLASGKWFTSAGDGRQADISRLDLARAAAVALLANDGGSHAYDLGGSKALSASEVAALASEVTGKPIQVVQVTREAQVEALKGAGLPGFVVDIVVGFEQNTLQGRAATVSGDFQKLTGRAPQGVKDFLLAHKAKLTA